MTPEETQAHGFRLKMTRWLLLALVLLTLVGTGLRFYKLGEKSLWSDEVATIATSLGQRVDPDAYRLNGQAFDPVTFAPASFYQAKVQAPAPKDFPPLRATTQALRMNVHPPLFFGLMHFWIRAFGSDAATLRVPAVLFGSLSIPLMALFTWTLLSLLLNNSKPNTQAPALGITLLSTAFMAFSAYQIEHAQDARPYTLLLCLGLLAGSFVLRALRNLLLEHKTPSWGLCLGIVLTLTAGLLTQYFFVTLAGFFVFLLLFAGRQQRAFLLRLGVSLLLGAVMLSLWAEPFQAQMAFLKLAGHYTSGLWNPVKLPEKLWRIACEFLMPDSALGKVLPAMLLVFVLIRTLAQRALKWTEVPHPFPWRKLMLWLLLGIVALLSGQMAIDLLKHSQTLTIRRYLLLMSPLVYLLMASGLVFLWQRQRLFQALGVLLTTLFLALTLQDAVATLTRQHVSSDEFKQAGAWIEGHSSQSTPVLVSKSGAMACGMALYLNPKRPMRGVTFEQTLDYSSLGPLHSPLQEALRPHTQVIVVFSHASRSMQFVLLDWLQAWGFRIQRWERFPGIKLVVLSR